MIPTKRITTHPGEILREEFVKPLGITANGLAQALRVDAGCIGQILKCKRAVTANTAMRLGRYFSTTAEFWINLQAAYDLTTAQVELGARIERDVHPREAA